MNTLSSCKIVSFIPSADLSRAREFYRYTLGFKLLSEGSVGRCCG